MSIYIYIIFYEYIFVKNEESKLFLSANNILRMAFNDFIGSSD